MAIDNVKYMSAREAVGLIESGDHVYIQGSTSVPEVLARALAERGPELRDVTLYADIPDSVWPRRRLLIAVRNSRSRF